MFANEFILTTNFNNNKLFQIMPSLQKAINSKSANAGLFAGHTGQIPF